MSYPIKIEPNRVYVEYNFLPFELIRKIKDHAKNNKPSGLNLTNWDAGVTGTSGAIILYDLHEQLRYEIESYLKTKISLLETHKIGATYTLGSRYSYIPWHADEGHDYACTIYLNGTWDRNWSGALIYELGGKYETIYPEYNKAVFFKAPLDHCTVMPNIQAPLRESLQIFVDSK